MERQKMVIQVFFWTFATLCNHKLGDRLPGGSATISESLLPKVDSLNCKTYKHWSLTNVIQVLTEKLKKKPTKEKKREN